MSLSNYPLGHPTGVSRGEETKVLYCEPCNRLWTPEDSDALQLRLQVKRNLELTCPKCNAKLEVAKCEKCSEPATRIDVERDTNASATYCSKHNWRSK